MALFEWGDGARRGEGAARLAEREACALLLRGLGFSPDGPGAPAGKLCAAQALANPNQPSLNRMLAPAARLAAHMGSGSFSMPDGTSREMAPYEAAGAALDAEWARALDLCGLCDRGCRSRSSPSAWRWRGHRPWRRARGMRPRGGAVR